MFSHLINDSHVFLFSRSDKRWRAVKKKKSSLYVQKTVPNCGSIKWEAKILNKLNPIPSLKNLKQGKYYHRVIRFYWNKDEEACNLWFWWHTWVRNYQIEKGRNGTYGRGSRNNNKEIQRKSGNGKHSDNICLCWWSFRVMGRDMHRCQEMKCNHGLDYGNFMTWTVDLFKAQQTSEVSVLLHFLISNRWLCTAGVVCACSVMSSSLWPQGLSRSRLLCPWNCPGKNTGLGCRDIPNSGIKPASLASSVLAGGFFTTAPPRKPL